MRNLTPKNIKSAAKAITKAQYLLARRRLMSSIKTGEKYGLKTVSLPNKPKRITQGSINRLNKLNERQKKINRTTRTYDTATVKYYYTDETGKRTVIATQTIKLDTPTRFPHHRINIKDFDTFLKQQQQMEKAHKIEDIGTLISISKHDTDKLTEYGNKGIAALKGLIVHDNHSMLGEDSTRQGEQQDKLDDQIERLSNVIKTNKLSDELSVKVDEIIKEYEEARTYYRNDTELNELIEDMERAIIEADLEINGLTSIPLEEREKINAFDKIQQNGSKYNA